MIPVLVPPSDEDVANKAICVGLSTPTPWTMPMITAPRPSDSWFKWANLSGNRVLESSSSLSLPLRKLNFSMLPATELAKSVTRLLIIKSSRKRARSRKMKIPKITKVTPTNFVNKISKLWGNAKPKVITATPRIKTTNACPIT